MPKKEEKRHCQMTNRRRGKRNETKREKKKTRLGTGWASGQCGMICAQCSGHEFANAAQRGMGGGRAGQTYALVLSSVGPYALWLGTCLLLWSLRRNNKKACSSRGQCEDVREEVTGRMESEGVAGAAVRLRGRA